ncbi:uncharacterized [Tachysurus ichikawai]
MDFKRLKIIVSHQAFLNLHNEFEALLQESQEPTEILHLLHVGKGTGYLYELLRLKMDGLQHRSLIPSHELADRADSSAEIFPRNKGAVSSVELTPEANRVASSAKLQAMKRLTPLLQSNALPMLQALLQSHAKLVIGPAPGLGSTAVPCSQSHALLQALALLQSHALSPMLQSFNPDMVTPNSLPASRSEIWHKSPNCYTTM